MLIAAVAVAWVIYRIGYDRGYSEGFRTGSIAAAPPPAGVDPFERERR